MDLLLWTAPQRRARSRAAALDAGAKIHQSASDPGLWPRNTHTDCYDHEP